jgi:hypothetical protein
VPSILTELFTPSHFLGTFLGRPSISNRVTVFNYETTDAHDWHASGSNSWYVAFFQRVF